MGQITTNAIVLRRADYRENDRMLTLFPRHWGGLTRSAGDAGDRKAR